MVESLKNELIGRLWLWVNSIERTQALLQLAFRAYNGMHQQSQKDEMDNYIKKLNEFVQVQPDYKPGNNISSQRNAFNKTFHRAFPTLPERAGIYDTCIELAIVYFCQIFNSGYENTGEAARNDQTFVDEHFNVILARVFEKNEELEKFGKLKTKILTVRDKMIGHSDAVSYSIQHGNTFSVMKGTISWREIDIEFWNSFLEKMRIEIHKYKNKIKLSNSNH